MFTGLIEQIGYFTAIKKINNYSQKLSLKPFQRWNDLQIGESIAVNGVCLTLEAENGDGSLSFHVLDETLKRSNLGLLKCNDVVNLERALQPNSRLGGHFVSGHIDGIGKISQFQKGKKEVIISVEYPRLLTPFLVEKGSIAIDGISLTLVQVESNYFTVHLIPLTLKNTGLQYKEKNEWVNLEGDILGKYVHKQFLLRSQEDSNVTLDTLKKAGW